MFRLAHISDVHLGPLPPVTKLQLASKRITGYINFKRNRSKNQTQNIVESLIEYMHSQKPDHQVITGDLINIGLDDEIENARQWLETVGEPNNTTVICGNHDAYVRGSLAKALKSWRQWVMGDNLAAIQSSKDFPSVRRRGKISIISCNSAVASGPFLAIGKFKFSQAKRLQAILELEKSLGQCRIVLIHHAPFPNATPKHKRLIGLNNFLQVIKAEGAELILHGHTHQDTLTYIDGPLKSDPKVHDETEKVPVICVPAGYQWLESKNSKIGHSKPAAGLNIYNIENKKGVWKIEVERHGLSQCQTPTLNY